MQRLSMKTEHVSEGEIADFGEKNWKRNRPNKTNNKQSLPNNYLKQNQSAYLSGME